MSVLRSVVLTLATTTPACLRALVAGSRSWDPDSGLVALGCHDHRGVRQFGGRTGGGHDRVEQDALSRPGLVDLHTPRLLQ